jgi:hypothetical protein
MTHAFRAERGNEPPNAAAIELHAFDFAEIVPTWAIMSPFTGWLSPLRSATMRATAFSMPRLRPIGLAPAATFFEPSRTIACASTVAVVVPSPAISDVLLASRHDFGLLGLFFGGIRDDDAADLLFLLLDALHQDALFIVKHGICVLWCDYRSGADASRMGPDDGPGRMLATSSALHGVRHGWCRS